MARRFASGFDSLENAVEWVRANKAQELWRASDIFDLRAYQSEACLNRKKMACWHRAIALTTLLRSMGIAARVFFVDIKLHNYMSSCAMAVCGGNVIRWHSMVEAKKGGQILYLDTWIEPRMETLLGIDAHAIQGNPYFARSCDRGLFCETDNVHGVFEDFPAAFLVSIYKTIYPGAIKDGYTIRVEQSTHLDAAVLESAS